jgi:hypothetical protein
MTDTDPYDLNAMETSAEQLTKIQNLLTNKGSDEARVIIARAEFQLVDLYAHRREFVVVSEDVLESPFFTIKGLAESKKSARKGEMSFDISETGRKVLDQFLGYSVTFGKWASFSDDIKAVSFVSSEVEDTPVVILLNLLIRTWSTRSESAGEEKELAHLESDLNPCFNLFGFTLKSISGSKHNFEFLNKEMEAFMYGEAKESAKLPHGCIDNAHELCLFGFATKIAKSTSNSTHVIDSEILKLEKLLFGDKPVGKKVHVKDVKPSELVMDILQLKGGIEDVARKVKANIEVGIHDALFMWGAVMQACHYTVLKRRTFGIVVSARVFWFFKLCVADNICSIEISDGFRVGAKGFLTKVVRFLMHSNAAPEMADTDLRAWNTAIGDTVDDGVDNEVAFASVDSPDHEDKSEEDGAEGKREEDGAGSGSGGGPNEDDSNESADVERTPKRPKTNSADADHSSMQSMSLDSKPKHMAKFGVAIPWLDQIGPSLQVLGEGRSGTITRNFWDGKEVALKTFSLAKDDERDFFEVYKHEVRVILSLRSLWGTHVPTLLFRQPWMSSPMIGLELGERMKDDMSEWDPKDRQKAKETIAKVAALGYVQQDERGANFVRLRKGDNYWIAMIDFETVKKIAYNTPGQD